MSTSFAQLEGAKVKAAKPTGGKSKSKRQRHGHGVVKRVMSGGLWLADTAASGFDWAYAKWSLGGIAAGAFFVWRVSTLLNVGGVVTKVPEGKETARQRARKACVSRRRAYTTHSCSQLEV